MPLVLVIDDEPTIRQVVREILEDVGHAVIEAGDGKVGLWLFREMRPDLTIVDLFMPEKEGIETILDMRAASPTAKIIAISGGGRFGTTGLLDGTTDLGATATLAKPFRRDALLAAVTQALGGAPPRTTDYCCEI
jgi:DNA-binding response OmpR family regulator